MKFIDRPEHPNVPYWKCPLCHSEILVNGQVFGLAVVFGCIVEPKEVDMVLPRAALEELEHAVEEHEAIHQGAA